MSFPDHCACNNSPTKQ